MRAAYLVDPHFRPRLRSSEFPSETTGKSPEIIEVRPDTDWMAAFPEEKERTRLFAAVPREPVAPPAVVTAPAVPLVQVPHNLRRSIVAYWPHAIAMVLAAALIVVSTLLISARVNAPQATATTHSQGPEPAAVPSAALAVPTAAAPPAQSSDVTVIKTAAPTAPPEVRRNDSSNVSRGSGATTRPNVPASAVTAADRPANLSKNSGGLPVSNPTTPITSPIPARALAGSAAPPDAPPPPAPATASADVTLPLAAGAGSSMLATAPDASLKVPAARPKESPAVSSSPSAAAPPASARALATAAVQSVIDRYRAAFNSLSVAGISSFWPSVNERALAKAFEQLDAQRFDFDGCQVDVSGQFARALCTGTANFVTKVGSKAPRTQSRQWTFHLSRAAGGWIIDRVESR